MNRPALALCLALSLAQVPVAAAQGRAADRIRATVADLCDAKLRCIQIMEDELRQRCARDISCIRRNLEDLAARKAQDEITIADLSRQIAELGIY